MSVRTIEDIVLKDIEKRRTPSKQYFYILKVFWSDGTAFTIGRQYSAFFDLQMTLIDEFPVEGGQRDPALRIIPILGGKLIFYLSNTRDKALRRMRAVAEFCTGIVKMPPHLSQSATVLTFFETGTNDKTITSNGADEISGPLVLDKYVAIAEYVKNEKKELDLEVGEVVEVVERNESGWWLVVNENELNGWVPGVYLEKLYGDLEEKNSRCAPGEGELYRAKNSYILNIEDELSFEKDSVLEILEKNLEGWWYARLGVKEGWVPATYLEKTTIDTRKISDEKNEKYAISDMKVNGNKSPSLMPKPIAFVGNNLVPRRSTIKRTLTVKERSKIKKDFENKLIKMAAMSDEDDPTPEKSENNPANDLESEKYVAICEYKSDDKHQLDLKEGEVVTIVEATENGWWLVEKEDGDVGWVAGNHLEKLFSKNETNKTQESTKSSEDQNDTAEWYSAISDFTATDNQGDGVVSFSSGEMVEVLEKRTEAWWYARIRSIEGWVPVAYLEKAWHVATPDLRYYKKYKDSSQDDIRRGLNRGLAIRHFSPKSAVRRTLTMERKATIQKTTKKKFLDQLAKSIKDESNDSNGTHATIQAFESKLEDGLSFEANEIVQITQKTNTGWWFGKIGHKQGWLPAAYLRTVTTGFQPPKTISKTMSSPRNVQKLPHPKLNPGSPKSLNRPGKILLSDCDWIGGVKLKKS